MLTRDRADVAELVGSMLGMTEVYAALSSAVKLTVIRGARADDKVTIVGDGINDVPVLTAADTGVAMGAYGAVTSSEAAGIVLLVDRLGRLVDTVRIVHRTRSVALQSVTIGISLSLAATAVAVLGHLSPLAGTMLQEFIDALVIAGALRVLLPTPDEVTRLLVYADVERLRVEYTGLEPILSRIRLAADTPPHMGGNAARGVLLSLNQSSADVLVPHERRDDTQLYPDVARLLGGDDPIATTSAMHHRIFRVTNLLGRIVVDVSADGPDAAVTQELQYLLYGLDAILRSHCA